MNLLTKFAARFTAVMVAIGIVLLIVAAIVALVAIYADMSGHFIREWQEHQFLNAWFWAVLGITFTAFWVSLVSIILEDD